MFNLQRTLQAINDPNTTELDLSQQYIVDYDQPIITQEFTNTWIFSQAILIDQQNLVVDLNGHRGFYIYNLKSDTRLMFDNPNHYGPTYALATLPNGTFARGTSEILKTTPLILRLGGIEGDPIIEIRTRRGHLVKSFKSGHTADRLIFLRRDNQGKEILASSSKSREDYSIKIWNVQDEVCLYTLDHTSTICALTVCNDNTLASASIYTIRVWDYQTGELLRTLSPNLTNSYKPRLLSLKDNLIYTDYKMIQMFNWRQGNFIRRWQVTNHETDILLSAKSPDGKLFTLHRISHIISSSSQSDYFLRLWNIEDGTLIREFRCDANVYYIDIINDSALIGIKNGKGIISQFKRSLGLSNIQPILDSLANNDSIQKLNLQGLSLTDQDITAFINLFDTNFSLLQINITQTKMTIDSIRQIMLLLQRNRLYQAIKNSAHEELNLYLEPILKPLSVIDSNGNTPLHWAVQFNQSSSLNILLNYLAIHHQPNEILDYLDRRNNSQPPQTALVLAQSHPVLKIMLEKAANTALRNANQNLVQEKNQLSYQIEVLTTENTVLRERINDLREVLTTDDIIFRKRINSLKAKNNQLENNIQRLILDNTNLTQTNDTLRNNNAALSAQVEELNAEKEQRETQEREKLQQINTIRSTLIPTVNLSNSRYRFQPSNQNPDPTPAPSQNRPFQ